MPALRLSSFLPLAFTFAFACSGAEGQDVLTTDSASSGGSMTTSSGNAPRPGNGNPPPGRTPGTSGSTSGTPTDCPQESEPNDTKGDADVLAPRLCGTLSERDQRDFLAFTIQPTTKSMRIEFDGNIRLRVDVPGNNTVELTPQNTPPVPFVAGATYTIEVSSLADRPTDVSWVVTVIEGQ